MLSYLNIGENNIGTISSSNLMEILVLAFVYLIYSGMKNIKILLFSMIFIIGHLSNLIKFFGHAQ